MIVKNTSPRWTRAEDGVIAGVCKGVAEAMDVDVTLVRIAWVLAFFLAGFGFYFYIALALALPRRDKIQSAHEDKVLGVCRKVAERTDIEVGIVRFLALISICLSFGGTILAYLVLYFVLPDKEPREEKVVNRPSY